tara:strand:+ start:18 stop:326 length:309 start_codon:yes stop_codon:yes gene_type:complete
MAMAITVPGNASDMAGVPGNNKYVIKTCTFSGSYASGSLTATMLGLESVHIVICQSESSGYVAQYNYSTEVIELYEAGADAAALDVATGSPAVAVRVIAFGR